jgi:hypothetical protein
VVRKRIPIVLILGSRSEAVLNSFQDYLRFQEFWESEVLVRFDQVWDNLVKANAGYNDEEIAADIEAARRK